jgi:hypothetical protein
VNNEVFKEFVIPEMARVPIGLQKVIELTSPSGMQIKVFG